MATEAGVYVHIPFCERLCPYCDFAVTVRVDIPQQKYTEAIIAELRRRRHEIGDCPVTTIYFGGGTPSLLAPERLGRIVEEIDGLFDVEAGAEVTVESNPNQITDENLRAWRDIGVERLSLGCQSFQDRHLHRLRRNHDGGRARGAAERALEEMERVSIDLIFGGPSQPLGEWEADLEVMQELAADQGLDHVSAYHLTIEAGTTFAIRKRQGLLELPGDDLAARMLDDLVESCAAVGLERYEVSNFAAPGAQSRHNSGYWLGRPYLGVGVGAHSLQLEPDGSATRRANPRAYDAYMQDCKSQAQIERLSASQHLGERLFLAARTTFDIDLPSLKDEFGVVAEKRFELVEAALDELVDRGFMEIRRRRVYRSTMRGLDFADYMAQRLYEAACWDRSVRRGDGV